MADTTVFQAITLAIASLGAVLGIINTVLALNKSRLKIKVRPQHAIPVGAMDPRINFCVEVTNLSDFAVTVHDVGVFYRGTDHRGSIMPFLIDGGAWPRRLEPRTSVTVFSRRPERLDGHPIRCAYARTQCGATKTGNSPALRGIAAGR